MKQEPVVIVKFQITVYAQGKLSKTASEGDDSHSQMCSTIFGTFAVTGFRHLVLPLASSHLLSQT